MTSDLTALNNELLGAVQTQKDEPLEHIPELKIDLIQRMAEHSASIEESICDAQTGVLRTVMATQRATWLGSATWSIPTTQSRSEWRSMEHRLIETEKRLHRAS
jgi:hypothetical protein